MVMPSELLGLTVAFGIGLLIGVERERAKGSGPGRAAAGVRTFMLLGLVGAIAQMIGPVGIAVAGQPLLWRSMPAIAELKRVILALLPSLPCW